MDELAKYKVVMKGTIMPNEDRSQVIRDLCKLFHSKPSYMEKLLQGNEVALKKEYHIGEAEKVCAAIRTAGAECKMSEVREQALEVVEEDGLRSGLSFAEFVVSCPACDQQCDNKASKCPHCGYVFSAIEDDSQFSYSVHEYGDSVMPEYEDKPYEMAHIGALRRFVGPNSEYYEKKFTEFNSVKHPRFRLSWHWPAFFVFFYWALYRKLWWYAAANLVGIAVLFMFTQPSLLWLIFSLIWPVSANFLYFHHAARHIRAVDFESPEYQKGEVFERQGGVSKVAVVAGVVVIFVLSIAARSLLLNTYEQQFGVSANPDQQLRGDGSVLGAVGDKNSKLARTSKALVILSNHLKVVIAGGNSSVISQTIDGLIDRSENEDILDAWGHTIAIEKEPNRVVLRSPGPDGQVRNNDDLLQIILY